MCTTGFPDGNLGVAVTNSATIPKNMDSPDIHHYSELDYEAYAFEIKAETNRWDLMWLAQVIAL